MGWRGFWRGVFSDPDGTPSTSRVATLLLVLTGCFAVAFLTVVNHALPPAVELAALGLFVTVLYATNAAKAIGTKDTARTEAQDAAIRYLAGNTADLVQKLKDAGVIK